MKRLTAILIVTCASITAIAPSVGAHERVTDSRHYSLTVHRSAAMPLSLRRHDGFRLWYRQTSLRANYSLDWWQLYDIYRWELRYHSHRPAYRTHRHHDYDWYRRYWHDHERRRHPRRR